MAPARVEATKRTGAITEKTNFIVKECTGELEKSRRQKRDSRLYIWFEARRSHSSETDPAGWLNQRCMTGGAPPLPRGSLSCQSFKITALLRPSALVDNAELAEHTTDTESAQVTSRDTIGH